MKRERCGVTQSDAIFDACIRHGLYRGAGKFPMKILPHEHGYTVVVSETESIQCKDKTAVRDLQRAIWDRDAHDLSAKVIFHRSQSDAATSGGGKP